MRWTLLLFCFLLAGCMQTIVQPPNVSVTYEGQPEVILIYQEPDAGRAIFTITDAPVRMSDIHELWVTVEQVEIHGSAQGWITVSSGEHRYDLLQLREDDEQGILADVALAPGTYEQIRLTISSVEVIDGNGRHNAVLPSGVLRFNAPIFIAPNELDVIQFDFDLSNSLHITGNNRYVLTPVIRVVTFENPDVNVLQSNIVVVRGGVEREIIFVGTDTEGEVSPGIQVPVDANIAVEGDSITIVNEIIVNTTVNNVTMNQTQNDTNESMNQT